ncbi:MAG: cytochrome c oxidase subunit 3 [Acidimicrobiales bacterium]
MSPSATARTQAAPPVESNPGIDIPDGRRSVSIGVLILLAADFMVLGTMVAAYFAVKAGSADWPPEGVEVGTYIPTVVGITAILGSFSAQWAVWAARRNEQRNVAIAMVLTALMTVAMANAEWQALVEAGFGVASHAYGTFYFAFFGYHIAHLLVVSALALMVAARAVAGHFPSNRCDGVRGTAIAYQGVTVLGYVIITVLFLASRHA